MKLASVRARFKLLLLRIFTPLRTSVVTKEYSSCLHIDLLKSVQLLAIPIDHYHLRLVATATVGCTMISIPGQIQGTDIDATPHLQVAEHLRMVKHSWERQPNKMHIC